MAAAEDGTMPADGKKLQVGLGNLARIISHILNPSLCQALNNSVVFCVKKPGLNPISRKEPAVLGTVLTIWLRRHLAELGPQRNFKTTTRQTAQVVID